MFSALTFVLSAQEGLDSVKKWHELQPGISFKEVDAPEKSILNDSRIFILKVDPMLCRFELLCSSQHGRKNRPADEWANEFNVNVVVNAGMFNMANGRTNKGYLKNYSHYNNSKRNGGYNVMMALNPKQRSEAEMVIYDLTCTSWDSIQRDYRSLCQGMRMIDCNGNRMAWDKNPGQACSMVIGAKDLSGNLFFVFTRSPYTHQKMIEFLYFLIPDIRTTVYLEGGPEASLYVQTSDTVISKIGSYVSKTYANDKNDHFWKIPNVIGIRSK
ncbi:MAG: phosphodiester glycosidase family protein [Mariniphaga sp.]